tara:strand:+ start:1031 stop:1324 length:294 start_codon:yes stop_codon:yes gene_type:complete
MYFKPEMDYWKVDMFTAVGAKYSHNNRKVWKFNYQKGYDPSEFVHRVWNRYGMLIRKDEYLVDRTSVFYKFTNYIKLDNEEMFNKLNLERLTPSCYF